VRLQECLIVFHAAHAEHDKIVRSPSNEKELQNVRVRCDSLHESLYSGTIFPFQAHVNEEQQPATDFPAIDDGNFVTNDSLAAEAFQPPQRSRFRRSATLGKQSRALSAIALHFTQDAAIECVQGGPPGYDENRQDSDGFAHNWQRPSIRLRRHSGFGADMRSGQLRVLGAMFACLIGTSPAKAEAAFPQVEAFIWDLDRIYPDGATWQTELAKIRTNLEQIRRLRRTAPKSARELSELLGAVSDVRGRAARLAKVGTLQQLVDTKSEAAQRRLDEGTAIELRVEEEVAFLEPMLRSIHPSTLRRWIMSPELRPHKRRLLRTMRQARYAPPPGLEAVPAQLARIGANASSIYGKLMESDLGWPRTRIGATEERIDPATYGRLMRSPDTDTRAQASTAYLRHLARHRDLFGQLLSDRIGGDLQVARLRNLDDTTDGWLVIQDALEPQSYKAMFLAAHDVKPAVRLAAAALRKLHGLDRLRYTDLYASTPTTQRTYSVDESLTALLKQMTVLGADYPRLLERRLRSGWLHLPPGPNKSSTVGVFWQVGGGHPHGLLTYRGDLASARTLGGAAVLMMGYASVADGFAPDRREEAFRFSAMPYGIWDFT